MLIGYTSDERYSALPDVLVEFCGKHGSVEARSRASGAVYAELPAGEYEVVLYKPGYGSKRTRITLPGAEPYHFRLLADQLLGYVWPKWVRGGEEGEFRVHSVEPYRLELWRYGRHKQHLQNLGWYDEHAPRAVMQITPDGDYTRTGVAWNKQGYHSKHHPQRVQAPPGSGLYYFHARTESGSFFSFPWIVAPQRPSAPIAVLASNITWNAYNNFGGRSNYIHADAFPPTPTVNARQELKRYTDPDHATWSAREYAPLSFDRPEPINHIPLEEQIEDPIEGRAACHVAPAEWRLLGWLEREGLPYDLYAETQLHQGLLPLDAYRVLVLSTHPEYWTRRMYYDVKSWVYERGGRLVYLGGNGLNCEVEMLDEQTMVVQNGESSRIWQPDFAYESRFAARCESEANLLGVVFTDAGIMTAAPYRVVDARHWCFAGTGLTEGSLFGTRSLHMRCPGGASGHETDKMSKSSPPGTRLLAVGLNPQEGGAHVVHYTTASGGEVFSVGSICWPAALWVDEPLSRITANVLRRFAEV
ncbi:MAG: hypothetical protein K6T86_15110 [Pirellulales bacterium]|nr:hypothetical protein [Pirellulales bacterium]